MTELSRLNLQTAGIGFPALAGVALGIRLYTGGPHWYLAAFIALAILWAFMGCGRLMMTTHPRAGAWIIETWVAAPILIVAFITALVLALTLSDWFPSILGTASGKTLEKLSATLVGAITTFTALVWTKDIADAKGYFWPSTQFKYGMQSLYDRLTPKPVGNTEPYNAMLSDTVYGIGVEGWAFPARRARAKIAADYLAQSLQPNPIHPAGITPPPLSPDLSPDLQS